MEVFDSFEKYPKTPNTIATIGTFDGVHVGHQEILSRIIEEARERRGHSLLISFHPHPRLVLFPENNPLRLLQSLEEKIETLDQLGLDRLMLIPFTRDFSRISSKAFIEDVLVKKVGLSKLVIGYDHRFGKNRAGGIEELREYADDWNYEVEEIPAQAIDDANVSSTKIRKALAEGDIATANKYLGYRYGLSGTVIHGEKQGRQLGYPTANLSLSDPLKLIPRDGVYAVKVRVGETWHPGLMSIGKKPTLGDHFDQTLEVFLLDFQGDLYGQTLRVEFFEWIRPQKKFSSLEALVARMKEDEAYTRTLFDL